MPNESWWGATKEGKLLRDVILRILNPIYKGSDCAADFRTNTCPHIPIYEVMALVITQPIVNGEQRRSVGLDSGQPALTGCTIDEIPLPTDTP